MKTRFNTFHWNNGYTLIELSLVVVILSILTSIVTPKVEIVLQRTYQAKAKASLGEIRTGINLYYSAHEGVYPLADYPEGDSHYTVDGISMYTILVPQYITHIPVPKLADGLNEFNGLGISFDASAQSFMSLNPPQDVFIVWGPAAYTPLLNSPFAYDNKTGLIYYPNGNYDLSGGYFFNW